MGNKLMDFQKASAERIYHIYRDLNRRRVLLADEVGLGKTYVARQVINLVRDWHRQNNDDFFKVVYICSNANIVHNNIIKLGMNNLISISESRLSMQHLYITLEDKRIFQQKKEGIMPESIIPLTPSTSFRFFSAQGTANERALMYVILKHLDCFKRYRSKLSKFLSCDVKNWQGLVDKYHSKIIECGDDYLNNMIGQLTSRLSCNITDTIISYPKKGCDNSKRSQVINSLRRVFAEISIDMLDPDFVIMDEFQRFNTILEQGDDEQSLLTNKFFDDNRSNTKILLLSATPYKPYTTLEELNMDGIDEHYRDFMKVMDFLFVSKDKSDNFKLIWKNYSSTLKRAGVDELPLFLSAKNEAEDALYGVMCRTERFNQGIINDSLVTEVTVLPEDILSYAQCQNLMDYLSKKNPNLRLGKLPMEYVKSSPYLLSFMDKYELKKHIVTALKQSDALDYCKVDTLLLSKNAINNYKNINPASGKLNFLHNLVFGQRHEKKTQLLLWVPASYSYYIAGDIFESEEARKFSKILLFSSWEMVPRMISVMMSYYSELYTLGELRKANPSIKYSKTYAGPRLKKDGLLEYPCQALAELYIPSEWYGRKISDIRKAIRIKIKQLLSSNERTAKLKWSKGQKNMSYILDIMKMLDGEDVNDVLYIPNNILDVLTDAAIASPAVCAYRQSKDSEDAKIVAKGIVSIFNKSESAAIIDLIYNKKNDDDYYESVLDYCVIGNLQAVLDEYAHMLQIDKLGEDIENAVIGTSILWVDTSNSIGNEEKKMKMNCHFAIPFIDKTITDKSVERTTDIRNAFNSPFRPFILSTTSIGQEGLDFHWYSRKIVHWNIPSNPVDLEQREGRINRFKCFAIRRNVVNLFKDDQFHSWNELFDKAAKTLKQNYSDIVPYWCLPIANLSAEQVNKLDYNERIIPLYPLSRDRYRYKRIIKVLALYRMTLGQPRQEELLSLLKEMSLSEQQLQNLTMDLCPYNKEKKKLSL